VSEELHVEGVGIVGKICPMSFTLSTLRLLDEAA